MMKVGMSEEEFNFWKKNWFIRIPKCTKFLCCHELMSCAIRPLCGCGSIYLTYANQECPLECFEITCNDCMLKYECLEFKG